APEFEAGYRVPGGQRAEVVLVNRITGLPGSASSSADLPTDGEQVDSLLDGHRKAWEQLWRHDIEIEGDPEAQQVVRACLFYLLASTRSGSDQGVPPMGLSSSAFNGHVFWDMDSWMLPAVLPQQPELARAMLEYRYRTLDGARANARAEGLPGASYAWESARTGRETLEGVYRHGRHVTGDVALAARQYYTATGDRSWLQSRAWPILQATADNWVARAKPDGKGGYVVRQVTTPDENAGLVDQSAWTQYVARVNLEFAAQAARELGKPANPRWLQVAKGLGYLRDASGMILSHSGFDASKKSKQADALLLEHPGQAGLSKEELARMYGFYAPRVIAHGPAMTDAIHAIVAARLGRQQEALDRFREGYRPFVRPPFHVFSEKRTKDNLCFVTGAAGTVESVLYGFAGLRLEPDSAHTDR
ncbi:MAG TPA: glycoside hydrolase family 65 protein, partial [Armatimonadota bacterium]|nr:glycoside hydrolase family 65 protein [Armatimonadota bacterium]